MFDMPLCTHTDTEGKPREVRPESGIYFKIFEKTQYLMNTLYVMFICMYSIISLTIYLSITHTHTLCRYLVLINRSVREMRRGAGTAAREHVVVVLPFDTGGLLDAPGVHALLRGLGQPLWRHAEAGPSCSGHLDLT